MSTPTREQALTPAELRELCAQLSEDGQAMLHRAVHAAHISGLEIGRDQGLREAKEANADEWQSAMFTLHGYAQGLLMDEQQDMPLYFMKLAELIAKTHVDDAHAERMAQLRAAAIEQLRGK